MLSWPCELLQSYLKESGHTLQSELWNAGRLHAVLGLSHVRLLCLTEVDVLHRFSLPFAAGGRARPARLVLWASHVRGSASGAAGAAPAGGRRLGAGAL